MPGSMARCDIGAMNSERLQSAAGESSIIWRRRDPINFEVDAGAKRPTAHKEKKKRGSKLIDLKLR